MVTDILSIRNAKIGKRNFSGKEARFNPEGRRNFLLFLESDVAKQLEVDGWNIRWLQHEDDTEAPQGYMQVTVSFSKFPPKIWLLKGKVKTLVEEADVKMLDWAEIKEIDLTIRPYNWEVNSKTGVKAYLKSMFVTIVEDEFEDKYRDFVDSASRVDDEL